MFLSRACTAGGFRVPNLQEFGQQALGSTTTKFSRTDRPYFCRSAWGIVRLVEVRKLNYRNGMTEPIRTGLPQALRIWRSRQKADGFLVAGVLATAFIALLYFVIQPGQAAATVMVVSLVALALACARLIQSAANVVRIRSTLRMQVAVAESVEPAGEISAYRLN